MSEVINTTVDYQVDGKAFQGHLLYRRGATPGRGLLMAPNFFGVTERALDQAEQLLDDDSVIFVFDPFGVEGRPQTPEQAMAAMGALREDNDALRARLAEALAVLTREAGALGVPAGRLAAFGFCFGGACVLELVARLPQMQRLVISEVFLRGKSQREVAATLGVTSQSVYCSKKAALDTLRRAFGLRQEGLR